MTYLLLIISAIFVNNIVLAQFLGICPFLGVSKRVPTAIGMAGAVTFVMVIATIVTWMIQNFVLVPFNITYLQTISFILVIAALVQMVEIVLKKVSPSLYQALGVFLPLITTNCAILGVAVMTIGYNYNIVESVVFSFATAVGYGLAIVTFAGIREHMDLMDVLEGLKGAPISLIIAGIMAMAFMGFAGIV